MKIAYRFLFVLLISMHLLGCGENTSSIEGKFIDGTGKPLSGISVIIKQVQPTQGYEQFETKTGVDGVFRLSGCAPVSEYIISPLSDKWKSKVTKKVKTLEAGQNLVLTQPIKIRFTQLKDGSVVDSKTGMQWKIYPVKDITAANVLEKVKSLNEGGFMDWRLPSRVDLESLVEEKVALKTPAEPVPVVKTCCAWVSEPDAQDVDWKFYVEEDNELWSSNKDTPDNRIVIVRNYSTAPVAVPPQTTAKPTGTAPAVSTGSTPAPVGAPIPAVAPQLPGQAPTKAPADVRYASRKECAEEKAKEAKTAPSVKPSAVSAPVASAPKVSTIPKTAAPGIAPQKAAPATTPSKTTATAPAPKAAGPAMAPASKASAPVVAPPAPKVDTAKVVSKEPPKKNETEKVIDKKPVKKTELAKATPVKPLTPVKKPAPAKKTESVKVADLDVSTEKDITLYFDSGNSKIPTRELVKLKSFFAKVKNSKGTIVINGHSDASANGEATGNVMLSNDRSSNVLKALHKMGLSRQIKLEMGALGDSKPAASNDTPEGRKLNRRVEINFVPE